MASRSMPQHIEAPSRRTRHIVRSFARSWFAAVTGTGFLGHRYR